MEAPISDLTFPQEAAATEQLAKRLEASAEAESCGQFPTIRVPFSVPRMITHLHKI